MEGDFRAALERVQSDYEFYVQCQSDPERALAGYSLTAQEQATLSEPGLLAESLKRWNAVKITISGTHDWVNRAVAPEEEQKLADELIDRAVEAVERAENDEERYASTLRLVTLLG